VDPRNYLEKLVGFNPLVLRLVYGTRERGASVKGLEGLLNLEWVEGYSWIVPLTKPGYEFYKSGPDAGFRLEEEHVAGRGERPHAVLLADVLNIASAWMGSSPNATMYLRQVFSHLRQFLPEIRPRGLETTIGITVRPSRRPIPPLVCMAEKGSESAEIVKAAGFEEWGDARKGATKYKLDLNVLRKGEPTGETQKKALKTFLTYYHNPNLGIYNEPFDVADIEDQPTPSQRAQQETGFDELKLPGRLSVEGEGALTQLRESLDRVRAHATNDPEFRTLVLGTIEGFASEVRAMALPSPRSGTRAEPPRIGHPIIEGLAKLWDEREALPRLELVRRFQETLDNFHEKESLGSFTLNSVGTRWVNRIATACRIKLMLNSEAVTMRCANQGARDGYFLPRYARRSPAAVPGAGSNSFPSLKAVAL
jgi:hypothetical protein